MTATNRLLLIAALLHVVLTLSIALIGNARLFPTTFDSNGIGISFNIDSVRYREQAVEMAHLLEDGRFRDWINHQPASTSTFHLRLYSITFAALGWLFGYNILAVEPLNLTYYLLIILLTYRIGLIAFSHKVGELAAILVGLWPSLLIHTTQMLRDPLFISSFLLLVFCLLGWMTQNFSRKQAIMWTGGSIVALSLIRLSKASMWQAVVCVLVLGIICCVAMQIKNRQWDAGKTLTLVVLLIVAFFMPRIIPGFRLTDNVARAETRQPDSYTKTMPQSHSRTPWSGAVSEIGWLRHQFIARYPWAGSNIDMHVELYGTRDVITYLPRAAQIGFFAPFPRMWFSKGVEVGRVGRFVAGAEMLGIYLCFVFAGVTLFYQRRSFQAWFLFLSAAVGCIALGYVVVNISALYRMRYSYFIPLIILAAAGFRIVYNKRSDSSISL